MPPARPNKKSPARHKAAPRSRAKSQAAAAPDVESVIAELKRLGTKKTLDGMARYAIPSDKALGVPVGTLKTLAKPLGRNHELAAELWKTGWYEARMLASFIDDPAEVTPTQMDRWCRDFDNWAICDTVCFHLFDRTPHAWGKVKQWAPRREEFIRRAAFALLWGLTVHDKEAEDSHYVEGLVLIEQAAGDGRNFVKKAVNMALRATGKRNATLHAAAVEVARRLSGSEDPTARWVGKDALRELTSPALVKRLGGGR